MRWAPALAVVLLVAVTGGCTTEGHAAPQATPAARSVPPVEAVVATPLPALPPVVPWRPDPDTFAPPVTVVVDGVPTPARSWTSCFDTPTGDTIHVSCADGAPGLGPPLVDVGVTDEVAFSFPEADWVFRAVLVTIGHSCRAFEGAVSPTSPHTYVVRPSGPAGRYRLDLSGRGVRGDVVASVKWTTRTDGPVRRIERC